MTTLIESHYIDYLAHMLDEAMQDKSMFIEDREGKNINRAEKWLKAHHPEVISKGKSEDSINTTHSYINKIRQAVHNARVNDCYWLLDVTRIWFDLLEEKDDVMKQRSIVKLDHMLDYLDNADDMTKQSYDHDLNGLSFTELCNELDDRVMKAHEARRHVDSEHDYVKNTSYRIINASDFSVMQQFLQWTD